jgi:hypothetical protein
MEFGVMRLIIFIFTVLSLALLAGCGNEGAGFQYSDGYMMNTFATSPDNNQCEPLIDFCESKGLKRTLTVASAIYREQYFPIRKVSCEYLCVENETYEKMRQDPQFWQIHCTWPDSEDMYFEFTQEHPVNADTIDFRLIRNKSDSIIFNSIQGEGDFSGSARLNKEWDAEGDAHVMIWMGIQNNRKGTTFNEGRIVFDFFVDGESRKFASICKVE